MTFILATKNLKGCFIKTMQKTKNKQTNTQTNQTKQNRKKNKRPEKTKYKWSPIPFSNPGPDHWPGICGSGSKQSPINIVTKQNKTKTKDLRKLNINGHQYHSLIQVPTIGLAFAVAAPDNRL